MANAAGGSPSLGLPNGAGVDEEDVAVFVHPGLVGVSEDEDVAVGEGGDALERAGRFVFEQILVDLAW